MISVIHMCLVEITILKNLMNLRPRATLQIRLFHFDCPGNLIRAD